MTTEELLAQIKALREQLDFLEEELKAKKELPNTVGPSAKQQEYNDTIGRAFLSGHKRINAKETQLIITFEDTQLSLDIEKSLVEINEIGIELFDNDKIRRDQDAVNTKYEEDFKAGRIGGIGAGGGTSFFGFIVEALVTFTFSWALNHIIDDLDTAIWEKIKKSFLQIFKSAKIINKNEKIVIIASTDPQIVFILPLNLEVEVVLEELDTLTKLTKGIIEINGSKHAAYKYTYNLKLKTWELETKNDFS